MSKVTELYLDYLNAPDVAALALTDNEIIEAVEAGLAAQGRGETVIEPRMHLVPGRGIDGHFNVLRGFVAPLSLAGVKVVGDFVDNYRRGLPSEMGLLNLFDPTTGQPVAVIDAAGLTDMRTGAVTAIGARHLARKSSRVLGHIGARGTAYWNVRLLDSLFHFDEIRVHSRRPESRRPSRASSRKTSGSPSWRPTIGRRACAARTSWWRRRACPRPSRCCAPNGSRAARSSCRTER